MPKILIVPDFEDWYDFAQTLDGYAVFASLGRADDIGALRNEHRERYRATGTFEGSLLELRIVLFVEARAQRHGATPGYDPNHDPEFRRMMTASLDAIRTRAGNLT